MTCPHAKGGFLLAGYRSGSVVGPSPLAEETNSSLKLPGGSVVKIENAVAEGTSRVISGKDGVQVSTGASYWR